MTFLKKQPKIQNVEKPKKTIKNLRDIEKLMKLMQENRISQISVDGVELQVSSFKEDIKMNFQAQKTSGQVDDDTLFWSS